MPKNITKLHRSSEMQLLKVGAPDFQLEDHNFPYKTNVFLLFSFDFCPFRGLLCRGVLDFDVRASDVRCLMCWCHADLDADPDLDASTNRAFHDVRDVGPHSFNQICALGRQQLRV